VRYLEVHLFNQTKPTITRNLNMTIEMREVFDHQVDAYKQLRNELNADVELNDNEKDWLLSHIQKSIQYQSQMLELELS
jgi:hypothetical protein